MKIMDWTRRYNKIYLCPYWQTTPTFQVRQKSVRSLRGQYGCLSKLSEYPSIRLKTSLKIDNHKTVRITDGLCIIPQIIMPVAETAQKWWIIAFDSANTYDLLRSSRTNDKLHEFDTFIKSSGKLVITINSTQIDLKRKTKLVKMQKYQETSIHALAQYQLDYVLCISNCVDDSLMI